jgi:hypothetical protein
LLVRPPSDNMSAVATDDLELLRALEEEERALSARRRRLHDQIDALRSISQSPERLRALEEQEAAFSNRRLELHREIDDLRSRLGLPPGPPAKPKRLD